MTRVLVCGDRNWTDRDLLFGILSEAHFYIGISCVIEGEARGADTMAREWAEERAITCEPYPANWAKFGRAAGPIRNTQMLNEGNPDIVYAFHDDIDASKGTGNMVKQAIARGLPHVVIGHE